MSDVVIVNTGGDDEEPTTTEVVEAIGDVLDRTIKAITDESQHDSNVDFLAGAAVATASALTEEVHELENRVEIAESTSEVALDAAIDAIVAVEEIQAEQAATEIVDDIADEIAIEPDEPPPTFASKFRKFWFGESQPQ